MLSFTCNTNTNDHKSVREFCEKNGILTGDLVEITRHTDGAKSFAVCYTPINTRNGYFLLLTNPNFDAGTTGYTDIFSLFKANMSIRLVKKQGQWEMK